MIYLIKSYLKGGKFVYKIGYSSDINARLKQYFYMNPGFEVVSTREGDEILESLLHKYLYSKGLQYHKRGRLNEWFCSDIEVQRIFHVSQVSLEKKIWKNRDKYFDLSKVGDSTREDNRLFLYLWEKNKDTFYGEEFKISGREVIKLKTPKVDVVFRHYLLREGKIEIPTPDASKQRILEVQNFLDHKFYRTGNFQEKMKAYCEFMDQHQGDYSQELQDIICFRIKDDRFKTYYDFYGTLECKLKQYREDRLKDGLLSEAKIKNLRATILSKFEVRKSYTFKEIKSILGEVYHNLRISKAAKATDLGNYFKLTRTRLKRNGKENGGFKLYEL